MVQTNVVIQTSESVHTVVHDRTAMTDRISNDAIWAYPVTLKPARPVPAPYLPLPASCSHGDDAAAEGE
jgi:hypothetical protein